MSSATPVTRFFGATITDRVYDISLSATDFHLTNVTLTEPEKVKGSVSVTVTTPAIKKPVTVAVLTAANPSALVDLDFFAEDERVTFQINSTSSATVCIAGTTALYETLPPLSDDEEEEEAGNKSKQAKSASTGTKTASKPATFKPQEEDEEDDDDEEEDEEEEDDDEDEDDEEDEEESLDSEAPEGKPANLTKSMQAAATTSAAAVGTKRPREESASGASEKAAKQPRKEEAANGGAGDKAKTKDGLQSMANGKLQYKELRVGNGAQPKRGQTVVARYVGKLANGKTFDSSDRFSFKFGVGQVIKGWDLGFANMKVGGKRTLFVHPSLGYGARGAPPTIPGNATLIFDVELVAVK